MLTWHTPTWADRVLDLRSRTVRHPIAQALPERSFHTASTGTPGWTVSGYEVKHPGTARTRGSDSYAVIEAADGTRTALVVSRKNGDGFGSGGLTTAAPGLQHFVIHPIDPYTQTRPTQTSSTASPARAAAFEHIKFLHQVLLDPRPWLGLPSNTDPATANPDDLALLPAWASVAVLDARTAHHLAAHHIDAQDMPRWRRYGFDETTALEWATVRMQPAIAAAYRPHLPPQQAAVFERSTVRIHPATAGAVHGHGWSATHTRNVYRALSRQHPDLQFARASEDLDDPQFTGDRALVALAAHAHLPNRVVLAAVQAGLTPAEIADHGPDLDLATMRTLAALRR